MHNIMRDGQGPHNKFDGFMTRWNSNALHTYTHTHATYRQCVSLHRSSVRLVAERVEKRHEGPHVPEGDPTHELLVLFIVSAHEIVRQLVS